MRQLGLKNSLFWAVTFWGHFCVQYAVAQIGAYPGANLRGGAGTRALALGGAFVAVANDVTASYWNPAGLSLLRGVQFGMMASSLSLERKYIHISAAYPTQTLGTLSISWSNFSVGNLETRDSNGAIIGEIANDESAFRFSYGIHWRQKFSIGGTAQILVYDLAGSRASGTGYDIGVLIKPFNAVAIGATLQNIATEYTWNTPAKTRERFPQIARIGLNLKPKPFISLSIDYETLRPPNGKWRISNSAGRKWHVGGEFYLGNSLAVQTGYDAKGLAVGTSFSMLQSSNIAELGYGLVRDPLDHNLTHNLSFLLKFKEGTKIDNDAPSGPESPLSEKSLLHVQIIEVKEQYVIISTSETQHLKAGMVFQVFQSILGVETGQFYGLVEVTSVTEGFAAIHFTKRESSPELSMKGKIALKLVQAKKE